MKNSTGLRRKLYQRPPNAKSRIGHLALAIAGADVVIAEHRKKGTLLASSS